MLTFKSTTCVWVTHVVDLKVNSYISLLLLLIFILFIQQCDKLCDEGTQRRQVVCYQKKDGRIEVLDDKDCPDEKPVSEQPCYEQPCDGVDWVTSEWAGVSTLTITYATYFYPTSGQKQKKRMLKGFLFPLSGSRLFCLGH